jgi:hypothetical protein
MDGRHGFISVVLGARQHTEWLPMAWAADGSVKTIEQCSGVVAGQMEAVGLSDARVRPGTNGGAAGIGGTQSTVSLVARPGGVSIGSGI